MAKRDDGKPYQDERPKPGSSLASIFAGCVLGVVFPIIAAYGVGFLLLALNLPPYEKPPDQVVYGIVVMVEIAAYFLMRRADRTASLAYLLTATFITCSFVLLAIALQH